MNNPLRYIVTIKIGYNEADFEFKTIEGAGEFAETVLTHQRENEDTRKYDCITVKLLRVEEPEPEAEDEEEKED